MNMSILLLVVLSAIFSGSLSDDNFTPFVPKGLPGMLRGAGLVFYAFIGFVSGRQNLRQNLCPQESKSNYRLVFALDRIW